MTEPTLLNFEKHRHLRIAESTDFDRFESQHLVPVVFQEFYFLATQFPLVFVRNSGSGDFVPTALMGLSKGKNLFCKQSQWQLDFVPTSFTLAPLTVHRLDPGSDEVVIAIDEESNLLSESAGEPMFQTNGEYTESLQKRIDHVVTVTKQSLQAMALCRYLAEKKLFRSRPLAFQYNDSTPRYELEGVFTIDEEAIEKLADEDYLELRRRGLMPLIYSHLTSLHHFTRLLRLQYEADKTDPDSAGQ